MLAALRFVRVGIFTVGVVSFFTPASTGGRSEEEQIGDKGRSESVGKGGRAVHSARDIW